LFGISRRLRNIGGILVSLLHSSVQAERDMELYVPNRELIGDISAILATAKGTQHRLVAYFLELALAEARRASGEHPALWYQVP
jgi:hypothetical protein